MQSKKKQLFLFWPDQEVVAAAEFINEVLEKYGLEIADLGYSSQSSNINAMLSDLEKPENATEIAKMTGLSVVIAAIIENNNLTVRNRYNSTQEDETGGSEEDLNV